jgi:chromosomal replication initiator protein
MHQGVNTCDEVWLSACQYLQTQVHAATFDQWFGNIIPIKLNADEIVLGVSDDFFADWLTTNFGDILSEALIDATNNKSMTFTLETGHFKEEIEEDRARSTANVSCTPATPAPNCNSRHTFSNFVVGEENRYAHAAAQASAQTPGFYNPLYIYGGTGTGKTHLLQAVAHEVHERNPSLKIRYVTCEEFLNKYVDSLRGRAHSEFRNSMRKVDYLLVDDVHQLANKENLQEEFFNTFNSLYNSNKQIILTSDKQPGEIAGLEARLISRFESGLTTQITTPGFETRLAILRQAQEGQLVQLDEAVLSFLATRIVSSIRPLKGALIQLTAYSSLMQEAITVEKAEELLRELLEKESCCDTITIDVIQRRVAEHFEIRLNDLLGNKRPKNIAEPRMVAMYLSRNLTDHSFPEIGQAFGKNHATVMNAVKQIPKLCNKNEKLRRSVAQLERQLHS